MHGEDLVDGILWAQISKDSKQHQYGFEIFIIMGDRQKRLLLDRQDTYYWCIIVRRTKGKTKLVNNNIWHLVYFNNHPPYKHGGGGTEVIMTRYR